MTAAAVDRDARMAIVANTSAKTLERVIGQVLTRVEHDIEQVQMGRGDDAALAEARRHVHDELQSSRAKLIEALAHVQHARYPDAQFPLGRIEVSEQVRSLLRDDEGDEHLVNLLVIPRHARGLWGDVTNHRKAFNEAALRHGEPLVSAYRFRERTVLVSTSGDRALTTVTLEDE